MKTALWLLTSVLWQWIASSFLLCAIKPAIIWLTSPDSPDLFPMSSCSFISILCVKRASAYFWSTKINVWSGWLSNQLNKPRPWLHVAVGEASIGHLQRAKHQAGNRKQGRHLTSVWLDTRHGYRSNISSLLPPHTWIIKPAPPTPV